MSAQVSIFRNSVLATIATVAIGATGNVTAAPDAGQYEAVQPPATGTTPSSSSSAPRSDSTGNKQNRWTDLFAYPKGGQTTDQQVRDRDECHKWAVQQSGFDPAQPSQDKPTEWAAKRENYLRAEAACLTARNYSVK